MTKVGQLFYEEILDAVDEKIKAKNIEFATKMLLGGSDVAEVRKISGLTRKEVENIRISLMPIENESSPASNLGYVSYEELLDAVDEHDKMLRIEFAGELLKRGRDVTEIRELSNLTRMEIESLSEQLGIPTYYV
jgi:hypothetical protein